MSETLSLLLPHLGAVAGRVDTPGLCSSTWTPLNSFTSRARLAACPDGFSDSNAAAYSSRTTPDPRWDEVWAEVRPWAKHPGWMQFYVEVGPGSLAEWTSLHEDDLARHRAVFGGILDHMIRDLDARLDAGERPS
jgi:hypothetical protein